VVLTEENAYTERYFFYWEVKNVLQALCRKNGHFQRMNESDRVLKKCLLGHPDGMRLRGRPKARYMELIEKDLNKYKITGWTTKAEIPPSGNA
jgi:hypothetical protein